MQIQSQREYLEQDTVDSRVAAAPVSRELSLDIWRGLAVILMIITHAIAFFHVGQDPVINALGLLGGTASFGLFLFLSGASAYYSYIRYDQQADAGKLRGRRLKLLNRTVGLLIGYYFVAFIASIPLFSIPPNIGWVENAGRLVLFNQIPDFAEFILPFIFFSLLLVPFRRIFKYLSENQLVLILVAIGLYVLGTVLWGISVPEPLIQLKGLIVGNSEQHFFPLLQYASVFLLGISFGRFLSRFPDRAYRLRVGLLLSAVSGVLVAIALVSYRFTEFPWLQDLTRWPPSISFLLVGLLVTYIVFLLLQFTDNLKGFSLAQVGLHFMGINAFDYFVVHTVLLYIYKYLTRDQHYESPITVVILFIVLVALSSLGVILKQSFLTYLKSDREAEGYGWIFSEKAIVTLLWVGVFLLTGMAVFQSRVASSEIAPENVAFKKRLIREEEWPFWWDHSYNFFRQVTITNSSFVAIPRNTWFSFGFDHAKLVGGSQSKADGADLRVVYYDEENAYFIELPFILEGVNSPNATVKFKLQHDVEPSGSTDRYFLYYGNPTSPGFPAAQDKPISERTDSLALSDEFRHKLNGSTNRRWLLKEGTVSLQLKTLLYKVQLDPELSPESIVTYYVAGTELRGSMDNLGNGNYQASIRVNDLDPGIYNVQATAREPENKISLIQSGFTNFYVTYPIYVTWTQDWEGWDVPDTWMAGLGEMANRYGIPLTHFFNPRIYLDTSGVSKDRANRMTVWVADRVKDYNDEIGLHLHMYYDMVRAAGVTPRSENYAPWLYPDGGGVAAYSYPVDEMKKILMWSRSKFQENGLPLPLSFRAGGWLAKENTLQALEETGFLIDSSGRTAFTSRGFAVPWNLSETTRPYKPNRTDINSDKAPTFNIWEFPDNGADSYWFEAPELIRRFDLNYPNKGQILTQPQVVTYLSHPPFYLIDKPKMEQVFTYIKNYLYSNDAGPVVYTTLENAYFAWDRN